MTDQQTIEDILREQGKELSCLTAPEDQEDRLRAALAKLDTRPRRRLKINQGLIAALVTLAILFSYSYDSLAYYGKKLAGYETIVYGSIADLNEEGAGQEINKSVTFSNGVKVTLDGIMFDENELVAFYRIESPNLKFQDLTVLMEINGINPIHYPASSGTGRQIDDHTQVWVQSFQAPKFFEKWLSLDIQLIAQRQSEARKINFTLDRSKAMKRVVKQEIARQVDIDGFRVSFLSLSASRLNTTIQGISEPLSGNGMDSAEYSEIYHPGLRVDIFVDQQYYSTAYAGINPENKTQFNSEAMGLPGQFDSMEIRNIRLARMKFADISAKISPQTSDLVLDDDLIIKEVYQEQDQICLKVASRGIPIMGLFIDGQQADGQNESYSNLPESREPLVRIYRFTGQAGDLELKIKGIQYSRYSPESIAIVGAK